MCIHVIFRIYRTLTSKFTTSTSLQSVQAYNQYKLTTRTSLQPVQAADVILAISKFKNTKSTGHDQINFQHIKDSLMVTVPYITLIIKTSIVTNVFPKPWKHSIIIPIHELADIEEPTNF